MAQDEKRDEAQSPLRGNLADNDFDGDLHDMGGDIGPARDTTAAADPDDEPESEGLRQAQDRAVEEGAIAVDSPSQGPFRDDPDDPGGGDTTARSHGY